MTNEDKIIQKLEAHDKRFDVHDASFDNQDKAIDLLAKKMLEHDGRFDSHDKKFDKQEQAIDMLAKKAMEHDSRFDELATKKEFNEFKDQVLEGQDEIVTILQGIQQEIPSMAHAITRHDKDITKIKEILKIA